MKNFQPLATIDPGPLLNQILRQPDLWKTDTYLRDYPQGPFNQVDTIFLRFPPASVTELERGARDPHECVWMDGWVHLPAARALVFGLMTRVDGERLGRVMINRIAAGGRIYPHADTPEHAEYWDRYHVVLRSGPGCSFRCGDEQIHMATGEVWWFQNALEHEVWNNSDGDRIHLIVDVRTEHLELAGFTPTKIVPA
jgi:hypothetical protein